MRKKRKFELARPAALTKLGSKRIHLVRVRGGHFKHRALRLDTGNFSWGTESITRKTRLLGVVYNASNNELVRTNTLVKNSIIQIDAAPFRQWYEKFYGTSIGKKKQQTKTKTKAKKETAKKEAKKEGVSKEGAKKEAKTKAKETPKQAAPKEAAKSKEAAKAKQEAPKAKDAAKSKEAGSKAAKDASKKEVAKPKEAAKTKETAKTKEAKGEKPKEEAKKKEAKAKPKTKEAAKAVAEPSAKKSRSLITKIHKRNKGHTLEVPLEEQFATGRLLACISSRPGQSGRCDGYILEGKELEFYSKKIQKKKTSKA